MVTATKTYLLREKGVLPCLHSPQRTISRKNVPSWGEYSAALHKPHHRRDDREAIRGPSLISFAPSKKISLADYVSAADFDLQWGGNVVVFSDVHLGAKKKNLDNLESITNSLKLLTSQNKNAIYKIVVLGDLVDRHVVKGDVELARKQLQQAVLKMNELAEAFPHIEINYIFGNHELDLLNTAKIRPEEFKAELELTPNIKVLQMSDHDSVLLELGGEESNLYFSHRPGHNWTPGLSAKLLSKANDKKYCCEDGSCEEGSCEEGIYVSGHVHKGAISIEDKKTLVSVPSITKGYREGEARAMLMINPFGSRLPFFYKIDNGELVIPRRLNGVKKYFSEV